MARTVTTQRGLMEELAEMQDDEQSSGPVENTPPTLVEKRGRTNAPGTVAPGPPPVFRRTVAPGDPPKTYNGREWPRGGHVRLIEGKEDNCYAKRKKQFEPGGALWVDTSFCLYCLDRKLCEAWRLYRIYLKEELGLPTS